MKDLILIVEDEVSMAKQLKWGLSETYDIEVAEHAAGAMAVLESRNPWWSSWTSDCPPIRTARRKGCACSRR